MPAGTRCGDGTTKTIMKKTLFTAAIATILVVMYSCIAIDEFAPKQRTQIESYLGDREYRITSDSAFVYLAGNKFAHVAGVDAPAAAKGDRVIFNVEAYTFSSSPASKPYYTNKRALAETISSELDLTYWNFEPFRVKLGEGEILKPLDEALVGSIPGDSLAVFLTSSIAYGSEGMGTVPKDTAVMIVLTVEQESAE